MGLSSLTQGQLNDWVLQAKAQIQIGRLPDYIPLLAKANPHWVALQICTLEGAGYAAGDMHQPFPLMSVIKPLVLLFLLELIGGERVFSWVGMEPSDQPFHSLAQLRADRRFPRNPMINSGAITLASRLPGPDAASRCERLRQWLNQHSGSQLVLDRGMLESVRSLKNEANRAIADLLANAGHIDAIELTLDTYNHICCLSGTVADLAKLGVLLAGRVVASRQDGANQEVASIENLRTVNALMLTCGLYETSGRYAVKIGLPMKSGVSGALLAVVPGEGAIACYSPTIDAAGNSLAGLFLLEQLTHRLNLSVFS